MSLGGSFGSSEKTTRTNQDTDPWEPVIPYLKNLLPQLSSFNTPGVTAAQGSAYSKLADIANGGNPFSDAIKTLTGDAFATRSRAPEVEAANTALQGRLAGVAN